jgi:hypothetical protein
MTAINNVKIGLTFLLFCLFVFGCGDSTAPGPLQPSAGVYELTTLEYRDWCFGDTIFVSMTEPRDEANLLVTPATDERGIVDVIGGQLTVPYMINGILQDGALILLTAPDYGQYRVQADTLWVAMSDYRHNWLTQVPYTQFRDGELVGAAATACAILTVRWVWEH